MSASSIPAFTHERVETITGGRSGIVLTVALHSSRLGPAIGGCRLWEYEHWSDGLNDALRLSAAMTLKNAAAGLSVGGGKSVISLPRGTVVTPEVRRAILLDLGDAVESFGGLYRTAEDVGTTAEDMRVIRERTNHVLGLPADVGGAGEPSVPTAIGVYAAMQSTLAAIEGTRDFRGSRITVSGLGQVGSRVATRLAAEGAVLTVSDINPAKRSLAESLGAAWVDPSEAHTVPADLFVPAGIGGVLTHQVIAELAARAVVGPANNPLAERAGADFLARRGILYAPDFIVNAGGVIHIALMSEPNPDPAAVLTRIEGIGETLDFIFAAANAAGTTPLSAAEELAGAALAGADPRALSRV
jgi:leucine dehydrogenase